MVLALLLGGPDFLVGGLLRLSGCGNPREGGGAAAGESARLYPLRGGVRAPLETGFNFPRVASARLFTSIAPHRLILGAPPANHRPHPAYPAALGRMRSKSTAQSASARCRSYCACRFIQSCGVVPK